MAAHSLEIFKLKIDLSKPPEWFSHLDNKAIEEDHVEKTPAEEQKKTMQGRSDPPQIKVIIT